MRGWGASTGLRGLQGLGVAAVVLAVVVGIGGAVRADLLEVPDDVITIQGAIDASIDGDVIKVNPNGGVPYQECLIINNSVPNLTLVAGGTVVIQDPGVPDGPCLDIVKIGAPGVLVQGFIIDGLGTSRNGIRVSASNVSILTNVVEDTAQNGIVIGQAVGLSTTPVITHVVVANNVVRGAGVDSECEFLNSDPFPTCNPAYHGILLNRFSTATLVYGNVVQGNVISDGATVGADGINVKSPGNTLDFNVVLTNTDDGIDIDKATAKNNKVTNNIGLGNGDVDFERYTLATPAVFTGNFFGTTCTTCNGSLD